MSRQRWAVAVAVMVVLLLAGTTMLWFSNTEVVGFPYQSSPIHLAPGESGEIAMEGVCLPNTPIHYRPVALGRWQQTHVNSRRDVRHWWETGGRSHPEVLDCRTGPWPAYVPPDVTWDRVAMCGLGDDCVEIIVERAD